MATTVLANTPANRLQFEILSDTLADAYEAYCELLAEHRSETALFGDSWPGARVQLDGMRQNIAAMEAEQLQLASLLGMLEEHGPDVPTTNEEPF
jgi:hypothetical protein